MVLGSAFGGTGRINRNGWPFPAYPAMSGAIAKRTRRPPAPIFAEPGCRRGGVDTSATASTWMDAFPRPHAGFDGRDQHPGDLIGGAVLLPDPASASWRTSPRCWDTAMSYLFTPSGLAEATR